MAAAVAMCIQPAAYADKTEADKWINNGFQPSTLTKKQQSSEMVWFIKAAAPFKGMEISVLSETIPTYEYESRVLTKAFEEITGINVPDYPKLAQIWWQQIGDVNSGVFTPQQAMDRLESEMDTVIVRTQSADEKAKVNEKPQGETIGYDELINR